MCGIFGIVAVSGQTPSLDDAGVERLRDLMQRRGPDDAGLWRHENAVLAHRRLSVLDLSSAGHQPIVSPDGRFVLVYNGELYNDLQLRRELESEGVTFHSTCDTETVLSAFAQWGVDAIARLRGMFALAVYDTLHKKLTLARDPLGVKPLYYCVRNQEIIFASEPRPIVEHPAVGARPNLASISAYLTTIRTTLGHETLFAGVHSLEPGTCAQCSFAGDSPDVEIHRYWSAAAVDSAEMSGEEAAAEVRETLEDSVAAHMRSDVPTCALLSGGIDSSVTALLAGRHVHDLRTYCAGDPESLGDEETESDLLCARLVAAHIESSHAEAPINREFFAGTWREMIDELGVPLSTPNEVAIYAVARRLRDDGCVVTISGEGADELLAGYGPPLQQAWAFEQLAERPMSGGRFQLEAQAWIPTEAKAAISRDAFHEVAADDSSLIEQYERIFEACAHDAGAHGVGLDAHLRFQRRVNLTGLLQRLDTATMLAGVEGRTPFADAVVASRFERLPMSVKFEAARDDAASGGGLAVATGAQTKMALRRAFADQLPASVVERPKASFPLPFQQWVVDQAEALRTSTFARELFTPPAIEAIATDPTAHWRLAWPMINIALWGGRWWG